MEIAAMTREVKEEVIDVSERLKGNQRVRTRSEVDQQASDDIDEPDAPTTKRPRIAEPSELREVDGGRPGDGFIRQPVRFL